MACQKTTVPDKNESDINSALDDKAEKSHTHDNRYYTESEMDTKLKAKSATSHTHNSLKTKAGTNSISFEWALVDGVWKLQIYIDKSLIRTL